MFQSVYSRKKLKRFCQHWWKVDSPESTIENHLKQNCILWLGQYNFCLEKLKSYRQQTKQLLRRLKSWNDHWYKLRKVEEIQSSLEVILYCRQVRSTWKNFCEPCITLANSTFSFSLLSAPSYRKFPAEKGNNVIFSVGAFVHKKLDIFCSR